MQELVIEVVAHVPARRERVLDREPRPADLDQDALDLDPGVEDVRPAGDDRRPPQTCPALSGETKSSRLTARSSRRTCVDPPACPRATTRSGRTRWIAAHAISTHAPATTGRTAVSIRTSADEARARATSSEALRACPPNGSNAVSRTVGMGHITCSAPSSKTMSGNSSTALRSECSHWILDALQVGVLRGEAAVAADAQVVGLVDDRSIGGPTVTFERIVESSEIKADLTASSSVVSRNRTPRSRMGRPYLLSPIWR